MTLDDQIIALTTKVDAVAADVAAIKAAPSSTATVDLSAVLAAIADVRSQLNPTPPAT